VTSLHALAVIAVVEALVRWVPLPRLSRLFGVPLDLGPGRPGSDPLRASDLAPRAARELRCVRLVADAWPLSRGPCLRRSLAVGHLLRRLRPTLRVGIVASDAALIAHAWVEIDGRPLERTEDYRPFELTNAEAW
jgi:hypothetical protein